MEWSAVAIVFFLFVLITIAKGIRIVPQGMEWVVERLGKYNVTLMPGLRLIIPFVDSVAYKVVTKDLILDIPEQEIITRDNAVIIANAIAFVKVTDTKHAVYGVENFRTAVINMVSTSLRAIIGGLDLDQALSHREQIKTQLRQGLSDDVADWGVTLKSVEIQDIKPSSSMQAAMEKQAAAERERKAMVTRSEGEKRSAILEAEGKLEAAKLEATANVALAEGASQAIRSVAAALGDQQLPAYFLLGEKYIAALRDVSASPNGKTVVLPADILQAVQGLLGRRAL